MSSITNQKSKRPLSPHLQIYKLPYNALMSITGRALGIGLAKGLALLLAWFVAVVWYPPLYALTMDILSYPCIDCFGVLCVFAILVYLGNGVRHVLWDLSIGVHHNIGRLTGNIALIIAVILTAFIAVMFAGGVSELFNGHGG